MPQTDTFREIYNSDPPEILLDRSNGHYLQRGFLAPLQTEARGKREELVFVSRSGVGIS